MRMGAVARLVIFDNDSRITRCREVTVNPLKFRDERVNTSTASGRAPPG
jgi:hypothetical protein